MMQKNNAFVSLNLQQKLNFIINKKKNQLNQMSMDAASQIKK
jgi:hypothetical protein